jgi:LPS-assembly protein
MKIFLIIFGLMIASHPDAFAQKNTADGIIFDAEDATISGYDQKNQVIKLRNKVQIIYEGQYIGCDEASIDTNRSVIQCKGNVRVVGPEVKLEAQEIELNYKSNTGIIKSGFVQVGQVLFEGDEITKLSATKYQTVHGKYTSCTTCPPFWSFSGSKVDAEIGGYAHIKNALIYFGRVPALWFPYLIVPLKSERQTGLLFPSYEYSDSSGFTVSDSFFWAMSDSTDSTWTAKYYTNRGLKSLVNYRYVATEDSKGEFDFGFLDDRVFSHSKEIANFNPSGSDINRWFVKYKHQYFLPYGFIHRMDINTVSDSLYPRDFSKEILGRGDPSLENRISLTKNTDYSHWSMDTSYYRTLLNANPLESNYLSVHRFPEINYLIMPTRIFDSNFLFDFNLNYVNFTRDNISYDNFDAAGNYQSTPDGHYDPATDLIRTGQRLDIEPTLTYPIRLGEAFNITPSASYRETQYQFSLGDDPSAYRRYLRTNVSMNTHFSRIYGDPDNPTLSRYKHVIQPDITYTQIPWSEHDSHTFFANDNDYKKDQPVSDGDKIQFDYNDRVYDKNIVTYSVSNKIWRKRYLQGTPEYVQIVRHTLSQSYDIHEENRDSNVKKEPWSEISSLLDLRFDFFETNSSVKYYPYKKSTSQATRVKVLDSRNDYLQLTYSQDFLRQNNGTTIDFNSKTRDLTAGIGFMVKYLQFEGETTYNIIKQSVQAYRFNVKFKPPGNCWAIIFTQEKKTDAEKQFDLNVSFLFDGKSEANLSQN